MNKPLLKLGDVLNINYAEKDMVGTYVLTIIFESKYYNEINTTSRQYNFQKIGSPYMDDELEEFEVYNALNDGKIKHLNEDDFVRFSVVYCYEKTPSDHMIAVAVLEKEHAEKMSEEDLKEYFKSTVGDALDSSVSEDDGHIIINRLIPEILSWKKI